MQLIAADRVAWSVCVCVCLLVMFASPAISAEPIEIAFNGWLRWARRTMY